MADHTHLRSHSDIAISLRPSSPTIRTHASSSIRSFLFFSSGGSTIAPSVRGGSTVTPSVRQQSPPPVSMPRDETAVEPFRLAPSNNYNPDRKQANGAYPMYDPPTAPPIVRMELQSTTPTQGGRTRYNPPAYTDNASPEAGGSPSSCRSPARQVHGEKGSADTQHSITSGGSAPRVAAARGNPAASGNVVNQLAPSGTVKNPQMNSHGGANPNTRTNAITGHGRQRPESGDTNSDMGRKRQPDTDETFSATGRDIV